MEKPKRVAENPPAILSRAHSETYMATKNVGIMAI